MFSPNTRPDCQEAVEAVLAEVELSKLAGAKALCMLPLNERPTDVEGV